LQKINDYMNALIFIENGLKKIIALVKINASISEMKRTSFIVKVN
jgi:hypothetical protein